MEQLKNVLVSEDVKPTYQRLKIFEYLKKNKEHLTVDDIYEHLVKVMPTISKTTVYNTLEMFRQKELVHSVFITSTEIRYEADTSCHHHFFCDICSKIIDIDIECPYFKKGEIRGNEIKELHGYFKGVCKDCIKKQGTRR